MRGSERAVFPYREPHAPTNPKATENGNRARREKRAGRRLMLRVGGWVGSEGVEGGLAKQAWI